VRPAPILSAFRQALGEAWAGGAGALLPLGFFAGAAVLVPLGIGTDPATLRAVGPGILWVALALSSLVTLERIFQADTEDGALDLWLQTGAPASAIAGAKTFAHWLAAGLPLALLSPLLALMFQAEASQTSCAMRRSTPLADLPSISGAVSAQPCQRRCGEAAC
jgi:heme exporter protein B